MNVQFTTTSRAKLNQLDITNGQIICLNDDSSAYYDMGNVRHLISGLRIVDGLPDTGINGFIYVDTSSDSKTLYVWNSTSSQFVNVGGKYSVGAGITLVDSSNTIKTSLLSETRLSSTASTVSEVTDRVYAVSLDSAGNLAVNVPWTDNNTTYAIVNKTSAGLVPTLPNETSTTKYLRQDGNWIVPPNTTYETVTKLAAGLCPVLPNETTTTKYLRQDGSWAVPDDSTYPLAVKNITRDGLTFTATRYDDTTFTFTQQDSNTTYATVSKTDSGLCPQLPDESTTTKYLRQDGSWAEPPAGSTYDVVSKTAAGLAPQLPNETTTSKYLRQDGSWAEPPGTQYSSLAPASGGTAVSLVTTGEKYDWNQKASTSVASTSANGLMSSSDKTKLEGIASGAEVNQNAFTRFTIGSTNIDANQKSDAITIDGSNVTLTPDATNDKITIGITSANVTAALGYTPSSSSTTYSNVSTAAAGLAPKISNTSGYLKGDGTWSVPTNTTYAAASSSPASIATSSSVGTSTSYARQDHTHGISLSTGDNNGQVKIAGSNVSVKGLGTAAYTASTAYATSGHTHTASIATGTASSLTMAAGTKYTLTAGGSTFAFTTPPNPSIPTVNNGTLTIQKNGTSVATFTANQSGNSTANIVTDSWTSTAQVTSSGTVSFSGLNDSYGYDLYCENKLVSISGISKSGSGTSVTLTYTLSGAATGDVCKLRILT